ncbi:Uncharacterised protein [uncultured archaeon]|nr:Uncharacterised protein [uncultured archaeon]
MIKSGGSFLFKGIRCVIGAVFLIRGTQYIAAAAHVFGKAGVGSRVQVDGAQGTVKCFLEDYDIALIELSSGVAAEVTRLGSAAVMEEAMLVNERHTIPCRVIRAGASLIYLQFPCSNMPQPGDSGSPVSQEEKVVGFLSSVMLGNCTGTAVSADALRKLND